MDPLNFPSPPAPREAEYVQTTTRSKLRGWTLAACVVCAMLMAGLPAALFVRSTGHVRLTISLLSFVLTYMVLMGYVASKIE